MALTRKERKAKNLYLSTDHTQAEIADIVDVNRKTIHLWIKKGAWQQMKESAQQEPAIILQNIHNHIYQVNKKIASRDEDDRCPTMDEINMLRKLVNMTKAIPEKSVGTYIEVFSDFSMHLDGLDHNLASALAPYLDRYVQGVLMNEVYGYDGISEAATEPTLDNAAWGKNGEFQIFSGNVPNEATTRTHEPKPNATNAPFPPIKSLQQNREFEEKAKIQNTSFSEPDLNNVLRGNLNNYPNCETIPDSECGKNGEFQISPENAADEATINTHVPKPNAINAPLPPSENLHNNGELSATEEFLTEDWGGLPEGIRTLKPSLRLSPYLRNGIIWISHIDDVSPKERQMNYPIRYYPDVNPVLHYNKWIYELKLKNEAKHQELH